MFKTRLISGIILVIVLIATVTSSSVLIFEMYLYFHLFQSCAFIEESKYNDCMYRQAVINNLCEDIVCCAAIFLTLVTSSPLKSIIGDNKIIMIAIDATMNKNICKSRFAINYSSKIFANFNMFFSLCHFEKKIHKYEKISKYSEHFVLIILRYAK